jgi:hypothetical protein
VRGCTGGGGDPRRKEGKLDQLKPNQKGIDFSRFGWPVPLSCGDVGGQVLVGNQHGAL